jgi:predicted MPP superfamily phosphohydrolase
VTPDRKPPLFLRRTFRLGRGALAGGLFGLTVSAAAALHDARYRSPYAPILTRTTFRVSGEHRGLAGLRIAFLTDTHVGPFMDADDLQRAVSLAAAEAPDLLLFGGDMISEAPRFADPAAAILGELARLAPCGGFAVLGNHDLVFGGPAVVAALARNDIAVLRNQSVMVDRGGAQLWIVGIDDAMVGVPDVDAAFREVPAGAAALALWHEGDGAEEVAAAGAFAQLSGHSHGGQVRLPLLGPVALPPGGRHHVIGMSHAHGMPVYVSRGVGVYRPAVRINCPPEVTLITLDV